MAIGDRIQPGLGRADTSGILRGTMAGAEALGQGIAALGAGVGAGIKQRKKDEKEVTATVARLEALKKAQSPGSPLIGVLDQGINALSNPNLSPREAAGMAAGFNQSVDDTFTSIESGIRQAEATRAARKFDFEQPMLRMNAALPEAMVAAQSDAMQFPNLEQRNQVAADRLLALTDPEAYRRQKQNDAMLLQQHSELAAAADPNRPLSAAEMEAAQAAVEDKEFSGVGAAAARQAALMEEVSKQRAKIKQPIEVLGVEKMQRVQELLGREEPNVPIIPAELAPTDLGDGSMGVLPSKGELGISGTERAAAYLKALEQESGGAAQYSSKVLPETINGTRFDTTFATINGVPQTGLAGTTRMVLAQAPAESEKLSIREKQLETTAEKETTMGAEKLSLAIKAGSDARSAIPKLQRALKLLTTLRDSGSGTGVLGPLKTSLQALGEEFGIKFKTTADKQELETILGDFVMARVAQTKGAVSNKEMGLFERWSASPKKDTQTNIQIVGALLKVEQRAASVGRLATELYARDDLTAKEKFIQLEKFMDDRSAFSGTSFGEPADQANPEQTNPEQAAVELGAVLSKARAGRTQPAPQQSAPSSVPEPAPKPKPAPSREPIISEGANDKNTKLGLKTNFPSHLRSPHVGDRRLFFNLKLKAEELGYQNPEDIPSGSVFPDPHRPGKFIRIP